MNRSGGAATGGTQREHRDLPGLHLTPVPALSYHSGTVQEAQEIVQRARMWRWKPYGEVTIRYAQVPFFLPGSHRPMGLYLSLDPGILS